MTIRFISLANQSPTVRVAPAGSIAQLPKPSGGYMLIVVGGVRR